jgi:hypothetical protein
MLKLTILIKNCSLVQAKMGEQMCGTRALANARLSLI